MRKNMPTEEYILYAKTGLRRRRPGRGRFRKKDPPIKSPLWDRKKERKRGNHPPTGKNS